MESQKLGVSRYVQERAESDANRRTIREAGLYWLVVNQPPQPASALWTA